MIDVIVRSNQSSFRFDSCIDKLSLACMYADLCRDEKEFTRRLYIYLPHLNIYPKIQILELSLVLHPSSCQPDLRDQIPTAARAAQTAALSNPRHFPCQPPPAPVSWIHLSVPWVTNRTFMTNLHPHCQKNSHTPII